MVLFEVQFVALYKIFKMSHYDLWKYFAIKKLLYVPLEEVACLNVGVDHIVYFLKGLV